jgi:hypothetical protein
MEICGFCSTALKVFSFIIIIFIVLLEQELVNRPLGRQRRRWVDNIKMDLREIGWDGGDWIHMAQDRDHWRALVNTVLNLRVP